MKIMIELDEARELVLNRIQPVEKESVSIIDSYHRVLAQNVTSQIDMPPFARSPLDGYAYLATASDSKQLQLKIVSEIPAGTFSEREIVTGEAAKIFTGAPIPPGANCVVRMEDTEFTMDKVTIFRPVLPGSNIVHQGEEIAAGDTILKKGFYLTPPAVGLLAAVGCAQVDVYRRPRVGLLSTGTELTDVGQPLLPGKIYNSNGYTLRGMLQEAGCEVSLIPIVSDQIDKTVEAFEKVADTDVVISTGGALAGDYDIMRHALAQYGCEMLFWKINIKPGTPASVGQRGKQLFFSLSGNPAAAMVTYDLLLRPVLRKLAGRSMIEEGKFPVKMASNFRKKGNLRRFLRAQAILKDGEIWADLTPAYGAGILRSSIGSHLLVDVPENHGPIVSGELLIARWIEEWEN